MKVIGLYPAKNEQWVLPTTLPQTLRFVDELLVLDGNSDDRTVAILESFGAQVRRQSQSDQYSTWRQELLTWARQRGGTHHVWLDADESFTTNLLPTFRQRLSSMQPGQKLVLDWLCLWKSPTSLRVDDCVWSRNYKDVVFCDDGASEFPPVRLHEGRTPGPNTADRTIRVPREQGAILHYQFVPFARFQMKQAFQRCREWVLKTTVSPDEINIKYAITKDDPQARCEPLPESWIEGVPRIEGLDTLGPDWFHQAILDYFQQHGLAYFEPLDIWHVTDLHDRFVSQFGREPVPYRPSLARRAWRRVYWGVRGMIDGKA